ncbi:MAG: amidohydrolase [Sphingobacteriales bacterium]|nr:MAG: amidohydrolase [Sphingobacteriales bacterium]
MRLFYSSLLCILLSVSLFAQSSKNNNNPDLILFNGKIFTGNNTNLTQAIAIKNNRIVRVGTSQQIKKLAKKGTRFINLEGKMVMPGINDAHIHFLSGSLGLTKINLNDCTTEQEALDSIADYAKKNPTKKWILGMGWQYKIFKNGMPNKSSLDKIISDKPVFIESYDGHSAWANSKALEMAGINSETKFNGFGEIIKDAQGQPTGAITEAACYLVDKFIPEPTRTEKIEALKTGMKYAATLGITSIQNASGTIEEFELYQYLLKKGLITLRSSTAFSAGNNTSQADINSFVKLKNSMASNPFLKAGAIKFVLDGVIESHTAVMLNPYSDVPKTAETANGKIALDYKVYKKLVTLFDTLGFQIYTHAIGDSSVRAALNAYEFAKNTNQTYNRRHRIEHIEQSNTMDIPRFAKLGVLASMEPIHADPGTIDVWAKAVGNERLPFSFVWNTILKNKVKLVFSSDWPACITPNPMRGLHNAVNRRTIDGLPENGWVPEQKISLFEALKAYTQGGAYSSFEEKIKGKIEAGYLADLIVLSQNLFEIPQMDIYKTKVLMTMVDGKIVYNKGIKVF